MELLILLAARNGHLVTRQEIVDHLWGQDVFVDTEHGINTAIRKIRAVLGDDHGKPRFVQTITGKGYPFVALTFADPVGQGGMRGNGSGKPTSAAKASVVPPTAPAEGEMGLPVPIVEAVSKPGWAARLWTARAVIAGVALAVLLLAGYNMRARRNPGAKGSAIHRIQSIAVLPLENLSGDSSQGYFADGMTDELITMLAKESGLRVVSRTSVMQYRQVHRPLPEVARELNVDAILEGSVSRSANRIHLNIQLIHARSDTHLWAESYDRDLSDVGSLQSELAQTIARQVGVKASNSSVPMRHINPAAHDAYLLGRYYWFGDDLPESRKYFQKAIDLEPGYATAWSGLGDYCIASALDSAPATAPGLLAQGEANVKKALALDDSLAVAHNGMAAVYLFAYWDPVRADQELARALQLDPSFAEAHHLRSKVLFALGRPDEALQEQKKSTEMDPFSRPWALTAALLKARQVDAAIEEGRTRERIQHDNVGVHNVLFFAYLMKGMEKDSADELAKAYETDGDKTSAEAVRRAFSRGGMRGVLEWRLADLRTRSQKQYVAPDDLAAMSAFLGRKEETLRYLERGYAEHQPPLMIAVAEPTYDFLRSDPRFQELLRKMWTHATSH
jgi:TolB-like protein